MSHAHHRLVLLITFAGLLLGLAPAASASAVEQRSLGVVEGPLGGAAASRVETVRGTAGAGRAPSVGPRGRRSIVGGEVIGIASAPWQVYVWGMDWDCGGSLLNARTVLTAAHCVDGAAAGKGVAEGGFAVTAGASRTDEFDDPVQLRLAASAAIHPFWKTGAVTTVGDVALVTVDPPFVLGPTVQPVTLPAPDTPQAPDAAVGQPLIVTGFGVNTAGTKTVDGALRLLRPTAIDPDFCGVPHNAVTLCAKSPVGSACMGDSGGPVVIPPAAPGTAPVQVGIVSNGSVACPADGANMYTSLVAPEVRQFVDGAAMPAAAPLRAAGDPVLTAPATFRVGDTVSCTPGAFSGAASVETKLATDDGAVFGAATAGPVSAVLTPAQVGRRVRCRSYGTSSGGVAVSAGIYTAVVVAPAPAPPPAPPATPVKLCDGTSKPRLLFYTLDTVRRGRWIDLRVEMRGIHKRAVYFSGGVTKFRQAGRDPSWIWSGQGKAKSFKSRWSRTLRIKVPTWTRPGRSYVVYVAGRTWRFNSKNKRVMCDRVTHRYKLKVRR